MKKVWLTVVVAFMVYLRISSTSFGAVWFSLQYWNPAFSGTYDYLAENDIMDEYGDPDYGYDDYLNDNEPVILSLDGKSFGSFVLNAEMDIPSSGALGVNWWQVSGKDNLSAYTDEQFLITQQCPYWWWNDYIYGPITGTIKDSLSYFDLYYSRKLINDPGLEVSGFAGWSFGSFSEKEDFTYWYDNETTIHEDTDPDDWYNIKQEEEFSGHGPVFGVSARAKLLGKRSLYLKGGITYSFLSGKGKTARKEIDSNYSDDSEDWSTAFATKRDIDLTVSVINAFLGFDYAISDVLSLGFGYRVSYWKNLPPRIRSVEYDLYSVVDLKRDDVALQGFTISLSYETK